MKRPKSTDKEIVKKAAELLLPSVIDWLQGEGDKIDYSEGSDERQRVLDELIESIESSSTNDGFELAKELDDAGWSPNAALVEVLDCTDGLIRNAVRNASIEWFRVSGVTPHPVGTRVKCNTNKADDCHGKTGLIVDAQPDGRYSVNIPELGHKDPNDRKSSGTLGRILDHEVLEVIP